MPSKRAEQELAERLWERVRPLLPPEPPKPRGGRPRADDRACFFAILFVLRSGCRWRDLPDTFPSAPTCWRRHRDWTNEGVWEKVWELTLTELNDGGQLDTSELCLDATFVEARKGGSRSSAPRAARA
jgi:transposase